MVRPLSAWEPGNLSSLDTNDNGLYLLLVRITRITKAKIIVETVVPSKIFFETSSLEPSIY